MPREFCSVTNIYISDDESSISYKFEDNYAFVTEFPQLLGPLSSLSKTDYDKEDTLPLSSLFKATEAIDIEDKIPLSQLFQCYMMQARHSTTVTNTPSLSVFHTSLLEKEAQLTSTIEVHFPLIKNEGLYMVSSTQSRLLHSVKQNEVSIGVQGNGVRPVFLPFFSEAEIINWRKKRLQICPHWPN